MATDTTVDYGRTLEIGLRPAVQLPGSPSVQGTRPARDARPSSRTTRHMEDLVLVIAVAFAAVGVFLIAFGIAERVIDGPGPTYPNTQHISPAPGPSERK